MESNYDQVKAVLPSLINGKTHEQMQQELADKAIPFIHVVNGIRLPWFAPRSNLEALKTFEVRDDDVYVFTYPRSGRVCVDDHINATIPICLITNNVGMILCQGWEAINFPHDAFQPLCKDHPCIIGNKAYSFLQCKWGRGDGLVKRTS